MRSYDKPQVCHTTDFKSPFPDIIFLARVSFILLKGWGMPVQGCENAGKAPTVLPKFKSNPGFRRNITQSIRASQAHGPHRSEAVEGP